MMPPLFKSIWASHLWLAFFVPKTPTKWRITSFSALKTAFFDLRGQNQNHATWGTDSHSVRAHHPHSRFKNADSAPFVGQTPRRFSNPPIAISYLNRRIY